MPDRSFDAVLQMIVSAVVTHPPGTVVDEYNRPVLDPVTGEPIILPPGSDQR